MIEVFDITCGYSQCHQVLKNLSFKAAEGEAICILGANGIGKTTLFKTLLGFMYITQGSIVINGKMIQEYGYRELASILSYVPQAKQHAFQFTVREMVMMGRAAYIRKFDSPSETDYSVVDRVLNKFGIIDIANRNYSELSGGEQQIVLIARAVAQEAKFIIMDEPASNLDYENQAKLFSIITQLTLDGTGIILSSHSPEHAFLCCKKALLFNKDRTYLFGDVEEVITQEHLKNAYGVDVAVLCGETAHGVSVKTCCLCINN